ncbi:hypothetical protein J4731_18540, partial [Providencia rettgeri]|nr:hypothetical protein [Providencia rettgeri]
SLVRVGLFSTLRNQSKPEPLTGLSVRTRNLSRYRSVIRGRAGISFSGTFYYHNLPVYPFGDR